MKGATVRVRPISLGMGCGSVPPDWIYRMADHSAESGVGGPPIRPMDNRPGALATGVGDFAGEPPRRQFRRRRHQRLQPEQRIFCQRANRSLAQGVLTTACLRSRPSVEKTSTKRRENPNGRNPMHADFRDILDNLLENRPDFLHGHFGDKHAQVP